MERTVPAGDTGLTGGRGARRRTGLAPYALVTPGALWLILFFLVPAFSMVSVSLQTGSLERGFRAAWNFRIYTDVIARYHTQLLRSLEYGVIVTALCLLIGYPLAYALAFRLGRWRNAVLFLVILPFFVSLIIRTLSWRLILGDNGFAVAALKNLHLVSRDFHVLATPVAVIGGLVYNFLPFMVLPLYVALERLDASLLDAADDLYASRWTAFRTVTLPLSLPGIFAGSLLTFIPAVGDYVNASLLGGTNTTMIGNVIQTRFLVSNDYPAASALSFVLMAGILVMVAVYARALGTEDLV